MTEANERSCGSCTACCKSLEVIELEKPMNKWCIHCNIGKGCKIYATKPASCTEFRCEWIKGRMKEEHRPDKTMVILDYFKLPEGLPEGVLQIWEVSEGRLSSDYVKEITGRALELGVWVSHISTRGKKKMFVPKGRIPNEGELRSMQKEGLEILEFSP